jgi:dihydrofolate reductase
MDISIITAFDKNQLIGSNNQLPWNIPEDLAYFKQQTLHHPIIMGRKTYESIGRPLPNRTNIVISSTLSDDRVQVIRTLDDVFKLNFPHVFVIGGNSLYNFFLPHSNKLYITHIDHVFQGDVFFPIINWSQWVLHSKIDFRNTNNQGQFAVYHRK